jgi:NNP family nitrate/nitrite transporter-like MFS transporter
MLNLSPAVRALVMSTITYAGAFAAWVINAVLLTFLVSTGSVSFDESQVAVLLGLPILSGAVARIPLGILTDRYGGRPMMTVLLLIVSGGLYSLSFATTYSDFLLASVVFGLAGGGFSVGVAFVSAWTPPERQGTALGVFGMANAGAALTTLLAPLLLSYLTENGNNPEAWRLLPKTYSALTALMAVIFFVMTTNKTQATTKHSPANILTLLKTPAVWRYGYFYFLVFGGFVALTQWILPYCVNVYHVSLAQAGLITTLFTLPAGVVRALGGWMSDKYGARLVLQGVWMTSIVICLILDVPKMVIESPGPGSLAMKPGTVTAVSPDHVVVANKSYALTPRPDQLPSETDDGSIVLPRIKTWHEPVVSPGETLQKNQQLARGVTMIYYPSNLWLFALLLLLFGFVNGIGKAAVYKFIPDEFPDAVGTVGGIVGFLGAIGGSVFALVFGFVLQWTGLWSSCWFVLGLLSLVAQFWMDMAHGRKHAVRVSS